MATHGPSRFTGPETIDALTADREKMWQSFTTATTATVISIVVLLVAMAFFLL